MGIVGSSQNCGHILIPLRGLGFRGAPKLQLGLEVNYTGGRTIATRPVIAMRIINIVM